MSKISVSLALATTFGLTVASPSLATSVYSITDLGKLTPNGIVTTAAGINNQGQITGRSRDNTGTTSTGYIWENGTITALPMTGLVNGNPPPFTMPGRGGLSRSINESGLIIGTGDQFPGATDRGMIWTPDSSGNYNTLAIYDFGGVESYFIDVNNLNQIAGYHIYAPNLRNAIVWENDVRTDLPTLGGDQNFGLAINDDTQVVGYIDADGASNGANVYSAAFWEKDSTGNFVLTNLGVPTGFAQSYARDIDENGLIVGQATNGTGTGLTSSPYLWNNGVFTALGSLGGTRGDAVSVNQLGQIVGVSNTAGEVGRATLWENGQVFDLNNLVNNLAGFTLTQATGINDRGQIIANGTFLNANGETETRAFLLQAETVPESDTVLGILAVGILGLASLRTRKK